MCLPFTLNLSISNISSNILFLQLAIAVLRVMMQAMGERVSKVVLSQGEQATFNHLQRCFVAADG